VLVLILWQPNFDKLEKFVYDPLDVEKREIRLLRIHRRIPFCDLTCELVHVPLDEAPSYQAVSYYWGTNVEKGERIILGTKRFGAKATAYRQFSVTSTVFNVLLRRSSIFASRLIWIDSICINQVDNTEKGSQVRLMSTIYKTASRVFVCLGDAPDARFGISIVHELVFMSNLVSKTALAKHVLAYSDRVERGDEVLKSRLTGLLDILHHPWFGRIWIIQEVVVAKSLTVLYSNYVLVWEYLMLFMEIIEDSEMSQIQSQFDSSGHDFINTLPPSSPRNAMSLSYVQKMFRQGKRAPLNELLRIFSAFGRTCPRDKIFALLGFAKPGPGILELIDYDKQLSDVLYDVAKYLYFHEGSLLNVLHYAGIGWDGVEVDCPSWVPNWTISREPTTLAHAANDMIEERIQYRSATQIEPQISLWTEARLLTLRGQKLDKIKFISIIPIDFLPSRRNIPVKAIDDFTSWFEGAQLLAERFCRNFYTPTKQPVKEAFWRTLIGDRTLSARPAPPSYSAHLTRLMFNISKLRDLANEHDGDGLNVRSGMNDPSYERNFETLEESMEWQRDLNNAGWLFGQPDFQRNFCITEMEYMGMVPKYAAVGDDICLIYGAQVPFVLRAINGDKEGRGEHETGEDIETNEEDDGNEESKKVYELVGECYIHGMMDGEGLNLGNTETDFTIK
jgi:Heterokaryon incompatibility protein (HET)